MTATINQLTKLRMPNGQEVAFVDWSDKPLYSTCDLLNGFSDQQLDLFQYTSGDPVVKSGNISNARTSTDLDTNVSSPGSMASTEEMMVYAILPEYFEYTITGTDAATRAFGLVNQPQISQRALAMLQSNLMLVLEVSQKWVVQAGLGYFNTGFGIFGQIMQSSAFVPQAPGAAAMRSTGNAGWPSRDAVRSLAIPAYIGGQEKYRLSLHNPTGAQIPVGSLQIEPNSSVATTMVTARFYLDGLYKRPVA